MEQHPIPQQISSYQFKLVGDMTLAQFGKAAAGIILAILLNASGMVFFIKYPLMIICGGGGLALAFVPFEDRPLETWIGAFIKSIYSPTIYVWKKKAPYNWLDIDRNKVLSTDNDEEIEVVEKDQNRIKEFIQSLPSFKREASAIEKEATQKEEIKTDLEAELKRVGDETSAGEISRTRTGTEETEQVNGEGFVNLDLKREKLTATGRVEFGKIPMPDRPSEPNVLVGMVIGPNDEIIEQAIVEVRDKFDNPVRVFKTNSLGQFKTVTPLLDGNYLVITEKQGFEFDRVSITMVSKIMEPIKIRAKRKVESALS